MESTYIMAVLLDNRVAEAPKFQEVLTRHGCIIRFRLGMHETNGTCARDGLITLQLFAEESQVAALENDLNAVVGVRTQKMKLEFAHA